MNSRQKRLNEVRALLAQYEQLQFELASSPKRAAAGTNGANQHTIEYHSPAELESIIQRLRREESALSGGMGTLVRSQPSRGRI